jgi:hypothetical protein
MVWKESLRCIIHVFLQTGTEEVSVKIAYFCFFLFFKKKGINENCAHNMVLFFLSGPIHECFSFISYLNTYQDICSTKSNHAKHHADSRINLNGRWVSSNHCFFVLSPLYICVEIITLGKRCITLPFQHSWIQARQELDHALPYLLLLRLGM